MLSKELSGIVASVYGGAVAVLAEDNVVSATGPASLTKELVVGDRVEVDPTTDPARVLVVHPRRNELARMRADGGSRHRKQRQVLAANIDIGVIVATAMEPEFEPELVDRYIVLCRASDIEPIVCLNKADLTEARHPALELYRQQGLTVIETSPKTGLGMERLRDMLKGKTAILLGKSGAGKSTMTNVLVPGAQVKTQTMSERAQQGQHTTTRSDVHAWASGSYVIDTPGIRTLDVSHLDEDDVALGFPDVLELARACRFGDCRHETEPGCAVREARENNELPEWRWESYHNINHAS